MPVSTKPHNESIICVQTEAYIHVPCLPGDIHLMDRSTPAAELPAAGKDFFDFQQPASYNKIIPKFKLPCNTLPLPFGKGARGDFNHQGRPNSLVPRQRLLKLSGPLRHFDLPKVAPHGAYGSWANFYMQPGAKPFVWPCRHNKTLLMTFPLTAISDRQCFIT